MSDNSIITILGRKGSGKTTLAMQIVKEHSRVVALDTMGQYQATKGDLAVTFNDGLALLVKTDERKTFRISIRLDETDDYLDILNVCYHVPNSLLVIEEASFFCSPFVLPTELSRLIRYGRHRDISMIFISRRPSELHRDVTAQSDVVVSFAQSEPRDIAYLKAYAGKDIRAVQTLPPFKCLAWTPQGGSGKLPLAVQAQLHRGHEQTEMFTPPASDAEEMELDEGEGAD